MDVGRNWINVSIHYGFALCSKIPFIVNANFDAKYSNSIDSVEVIFLAFLLKFLLYSDGRDTEIGTFSQLQWQNQTTKRMLQRNWLEARARIENAFQNGREIDGNSMQRKWFECFYCPLLSTLKT